MGYYSFRRQPHRMVKYTQTIRRFQACLCIRMSVDTKFRFFHSIVTNLSYQRVNKTPHQIRDNENLNCRRNENRKYLSEEINFFVCTPSCYFFHIFHRPPIPNFQRNVLFECPLSKNCIICANFEKKNWNRYFLMSE